MNESETRAELDCSSKRDFTHPKMAPEKKIRRKKNEPARRDGKSTVSKRVRHGKKRSRHTHLLLDLRPDRVEDQQVEGEMNDPRVQELSE